MSVLLSKLKWVLEIKKHHLVNNGKPLNVFAFDKVKKFFLEINKNHLVNNGKTLHPYVMPLTKIKKCFIK